LIAFAARPGPHTRGKPGLIKIERRIPKVGALTAYVLPILYALLGALAYALRALAQEATARTYIQSSAAFARIIIALIAGLVVGLFNNLTQGISLSPLGIAFLVGYGVELFFSLLDAFLETLKKVRT
jgi:drug/metabolite transporter (DMT)-like permease